MKQVSKVTGYLLFEVSIICALYDLSLHSDFVAWGDSRRDGLDVLSVCYLFIPAMAILSLAKIFFWEKYNFNRFSSLLYAGIFSFVFLCYAFMSTQTGLLIVLLTGLVIAVLHLVELCITLRNNYDEV